MRHLMLAALIVVAAYLAWPADDHVLVNHFDPELMARYWHEATQVGASAVR